MKKRFKKFLGWSIYWLIGVAAYSFGAWVVGHGVMIIICIAYAGFVALISLAEILIKGVKR